MHSHLEIEFGHVPCNGAEQAAARDGLVLLQQACPAVGDCRVALDGPADGHHLHQPLSVHLCIQVPGTEVSVDQQQRSGQSAAATIRQAFGTAQQILLAWHPAHQAPLERQDTATPSSQPLP